MESPPLMQPKSISPATKHIPIINLARQQSQIRAGIDSAIQKVLDHGGYIMGPEVHQLEQKLAEYSGTKHAITCSSGTDALLLALMAKDILPGDVVLVPSFTFSATAEVVALLGAQPVFVDVDTESFNIDLASLQSMHAKTIAKAKRPVGVIAVDMFGQPSDYQALQQWVNQQGLWLICDAAQSFGASYKQIPVGNFGDITTTSFYPSKPLGCYGDGGAVFTNNDILAERLKSYRIHGEGSNKYDNVRVGLNARLDTIQAAILLEKIKIFREEVIQRQALAQYYTKELSAYVTTPKMSAHAKSTWAQYTIKVPAEIRATLQAQLKERGIGTCIYYPIPLHKQPAYKVYTKDIDTRLANCEQLCNSVLSLPMGCSIEDAQYVCTSIQEIMTHLGNPKQESE